MDRSDWEKKASIATVKMADELLEIVHSFDSDLKLNYTGSYIGLAKNSRSTMFVNFRPIPGHLWLALKLENTDGNYNIIKAARFRKVIYRQNQFRVKLLPGDIERYTSTLTRIIEMAYRKWVS